jgi:hypothetical protein
MPYFSPIAELQKYPNEIQIIIKSYIVNDFAFIFKKNDYLGYILPVQSIYHMGIKRVMYNFYVSDVAGSVIDKCYNTHYIEEELGDYVVIKIRYKQEFTKNPNVMMWENYRTYLHRNLLFVISLSGMEIKFSSRNTSIIFENMEGSLYIDSCCLIPSSKKRKY